MAKVKQVVRSHEFPLDKDGIRNAPNSSGVFEILRDTPYYRYRGETRVLNIGESGDPRSEIRNRLHRHTTANRLKKIEDMHNVTFTFHVCSDPKTEETRLLKEFEDQHFDLPVLNSQRGISAEQIDG